MDDSHLDEYSEKMESMMQSFINAGRDSEFSDSEPVENEDFDSNLLFNRRPSGHGFATFESPSTSDDTVAQHAIPTVPLESRWERGPTLFVMNVKVRKQRHPLEIHENDLPDELARQFCETHGLPTTVISQLTDLIIQHRSEFAHEVIDSNAEELFSPHPPKEPPPQKRPQSRRGRRRRRKNKSKRKTRAPSLDRAMSENDGMVEQFQSILSNHYKTMKSSSKRPKRRARSVPHRRRKSKRKRDPHVFNRLYKDHAKRKSKRELAVAEANLARHRKYSNRKITLSKGSQRMINHKHHRGDVGDRLYSLAKKREHELKIKRKTWEHQQEQIEIESVTFQPAISKRARNLNRCGSKLWKRIKDPMGHESRKTIHDLREKIIREEMQRCPFHPKVNKKSADIAVKSRSGQSDLHHRLYQEAEKQGEDFLEKKSEIEFRRKCPFQPKISRRSKELALIRQPRPPSSGKKFVRGGIVTAKCLFQSHCESQLFRKDDRLRIVGFDDDAILVNTLSGSWLRPAKIDPIQFHKLNIVDNRRRNARDPSTGQLLFHPVINKMSQKLQKLKRQHVRDFENIGDYLHHEGLEQGSAPLNPNLTFSPKLCRNSQHIARNLSDKHCEEVWKAIAGERESISVTSIQNLSELSPEEAMVVCNMLNELVDQKSIAYGEPVLTFPEFCEKFSQFERETVQGPRFSVKTEYVEASPISCPSFTPVLSPKAQKIERNSEDVFENLYAVAQKQREKRSEKVQSKFEHAKQMLEETLKGATTNYSTPKRFKEKFEF